MDVIKKVKESTIHTLDVDVMKDKKTAVNNQWASPASAKSEIENKCGCDHKIK